MTQQEAGELLDKAVLVVGLVAGLISAYFALDLCCHGAITRSIDRQIEKLRSAKQEQAKISRDAKFVQFEAQEIIREHDPDQPAGPDAQSMG